MNNSLTNKIEEILMKYRKGVMWICMDTNDGEAPKHIEVLTHEQTKAAILEAISSYTKAIIGEKKKVEVLPRNMWMDKGYPDPMDTGYRIAQEDMKQRAKELL